LGKQLTGVSVVSKAKWTLMASRCSASL